MILTAPDGSNVELAVAVKLWSTAPTGAVVGVLSRLQDRTSRPVLLLTDYTSKPLRDVCEKLGMGYLDEGGWSFLNLEDPVVFIRTEGTAGRAPRVSSEVVRLNGVAVSRTIETLLEVDPPLGVRELATRAGVSSPGSVSKLLPTLAAANAISRDSAGRVVDIRRRLLLERWVQDYSFLSGNGVVLDFLAPRGLDGVLDQIRSTPSICVTGGIAARDYLRDGLVPVVPTTRLTVYAEDGGAWARGVGLVRVDRAVSNVIVARPKDLRILLAPRKGRSSLPLAPRGQVLADLLTLPGRETSLADQLMDQLELEDPLWRT
ncbi:hypothetical protein [Nocardioides plantarum]|uniref:HTH iclR-type domain-containing protein n=1 Tax=Nocardioides plantarum TaxID=29299 RepID=A0ABV5KEP6_9ACTN|nr:hypothetical protein [Nocardioides plantarum]